MLLYNTELAVVCFALSVLWYARLVSNNPILSQPNRVVSTQVVENIHHVYTQ